MAVDNKDRMKKRNMELGRMLQDARTSRNVTISECASLLGTGRSRYRNIESGEAYVSAVELELLQEFLGIPVEATWSAGKGGERRIHRLPVSVSPDETIYLIVDVSQSVG